MINQEKKINKKSGFTLIETLVAVFIMTVSITSLMTVVTSSLFAARYTRDKVTATYLAQEAIDYIRNDRDTTVFLQQNLNNQEAWDLFTQKYSKCTDDPQNGCYLDVSNEDEITVLPTCNLAEDNCNFYFNKDGTNSFYNYNNEGVKTSFKRKIVVNTTNEQMEAQVIISWLNGGTTRTVSLKTSLMNW
jgi:prepilin-type N-terminal cleavage/methylation domain-containing protein